MLFYPLWVLFSRFSCKLAVLPLPVSVDKGWLKPRCVEFIERSFWQQHDYQGCVCVSLSVLQILLVLQKNLKLLVEFYRSCEQMVLYFMSWKKKQLSLWQLKVSPSSIPHLPLPCSFFLPTFCLFSYLYSFLSSLLYTIFLSCIDSALLCLREPASKLSAASGLKAISSASLPLQVRSWDW